jgi:flavodoxin
MAEDTTGSTGRVLVVYYSVTGNTARVGRDIAKATGGDLESLRDSGHGVGFWAYLKAILDAVRGRSADLGELKFIPHNYDLTIIGTPVWAWNMTPVVRAYLGRYKAQLGNVAFYVTSGDTDASKIVPSMESIVGRRAVAFTGFNARQLADHRVYAARLEAFVQSLKGPAVAPASRVDPKADLEGEVA